MHSSGLLNSLGPALRGPGTPRSGGRGPPPHAGSARGVPRAEHRSSGVLPSGGCGGAPRLGGSPSRRPALGHLHDRRGAPQRLPEPVSEKVPRGLSFPLRGVSSGGAGGEHAVGVDTQRVSLEVGSLDACRWRALANVEQSRLCWHFCFLSLSSGV